MVQVSVDVANVRGGPGTEYNIVGQASKGAKYVVTSQSGNWWQIDYQGQTGWIFGQIVQILNTTSTSSSASPQRCTFAGTEPRIPDPVGLSVYDCEAWESAYMLLLRDNPLVAFASFDSNDRVELTKAAFDLLRRATLNCNTSIYEAVRMAMVGGDLIEEHGNPVEPGILNAPRLAVLAGLNEVTGTLEECQTVVALTLDNLLP